MTGRVRALIDEQLSRAEKNETCLAATTETERDRLKRAAATGHVVEVAPLVFARPAHWAQLKPIARTRHVIRALQVRHPNWVFAGPSAAAAWGLAVSNHYLDTVWLATSRKAHRRATSYTRPIVVSGNTIETVDGVRVTPLARTTADCLRVMDFRSGLAIADSALRVEGQSLDQLTKDIERLCPRMPGLDRIRHLLALADARSESGGESIARATMLELGIAPPDLQRAFNSPLSSQEAYRVDFAWDVAEGCILAEFDGLEKYVSVEMTHGKTVAQVIENEHRRQSMLEADEHVVRVIRFGYTDVRREGDFLRLLTSCGVPRTCALDMIVQKAGGILRCR